MIILRQESNQFQRVKQVLSHAANAKQQPVKYSYLIQWQNQRLSSTWEPENNCDPIKPLIKAYFQAKVPHNIKTREDFLDDSLKFIVPPTKSEKKQAESIESLKLKQQQMAFNVLKAKEKRKIITQIRELDERIRQGSPQQRRDHQIDYVEGVFKNRRGKTSFVVRTLQYSKFFVVSLDKMREHFPKSLKKYFINLLELNTLDNSYDAQLEYNFNYIETQKDQVPTRQSNNGGGEAERSEREEISDLSSSSSSSSSSSDS